MMRKFLSLVILSLFCGIISLSAEETVPNGFRGIEFGMSVDQVKEALKKDSSFGFRGDRDVSLLPGENRSLIETDTSRTAPYSFFERCWFQFYEDKLYIITINLKPSKVDHYSIFSSLSKKYGKPSSLNPEKTEWISNSTIMALERPLTLKYTDKNVFEKLQKDAMVEKTAEENSLQDFLDSL